ncbi:MAG: glycosyltransferase family 2 protein [Firmicutes bacterium]|nr:glycosyltransferase family 2 protein [Bacillota bacterium]
MFAAVIPVKNEAARLEQVIINLAAANSLDLIIPVLNGCTDNSLAILEQVNCPILAPLCFQEPLGIDVPRAIGARAAQRLDAEGVIFVDGDMTGVNSTVLGQLVQAVRQKGVDLALTDCYPPEFDRNLSPPASCLLDIRRKLNNALGVSRIIGSASPSHGPHAVSGRMLRLTEAAYFAIPPLLLVHAARHGLNIRAGTVLPHALLGSPARSSTHALQIAETIAGDYLAALRMFAGKSGDRTFAGHEYIGYHNQRRFDLLADFASGLITGDCFA